MACRGPENGTVGVLIVRVEQKPVESVRRVLVLGFMEASDVPTLRRAMPERPGADVRLIAYRVWRCEKTCVQELLDRAHAVRATGGSWVWVMPAPELLRRLDSVGELSYVETADDVDRQLAADWA